MGNEGRIIGRQKAVDDSLLCVVEVCWRSSLIKLSSNW